MARSFLGASFMFAIGIAGALGCYTGASIEPDEPHGGSSGSTTSTTSDPTETAAAPMTGLPCDVADVLARTCVSCHGAKLAGGATNSMTTYEELVAPSKTDPKKSYAALSIDRMKNTKTPMPPTGVAPKSDVGVFEAWVAAGTPKGSCAAPVKPGPDAGPPPPSSDYDTPVVCTSNAHWIFGNIKSQNMHPGVACIDCHQKKGPLYTFAGTVFPTAHEPDDCNGGPGSVQIVITGSDGKSQTLTPNAVGSFFSTKTMAMPYRAKVVSGGKVREMVGPQTNGDCNTCHTQNGAEKAPGRVMAP